MSEEFVYTGVQATEEEEQEMRQPVITSGLFGFLGSGGGPGRYEKIHACALKHELPEIPGYYGYDFERHEFIRRPFEHRNSNEV